MCHHFFVHFMQQHWGDAKSNLLLAQINTDPFECVQLAFSLSGTMCVKSACAFTCVFTFTVCLLLSTSLSLAGIWVILPGYCTAATRAALPIPVSVCRISCVSNQCYGCQCLGFLTCAKMFMHSIEHWGCTDTASESALKVDSGRKIPYHTRDSNPVQYCTLVFQLDALPTELFPPPSHLVAIKTQNQSHSLILHRMKVEQHASY